MEKFIDQLYNAHVDDNVRGEIVQQTNSIVKERSDEIVDKVIEQVSRKILEKKSVRTGRYTGAKRSDPPLVVLS